jgi:hypothetical protein
MVKLSFLLGKNGCFELLAIQAVGFAKPMSLPASFTALMDGYHVALLIKDLIHQYRLGTNLIHGSTG